MVTIRLINPKHGFGEINNGKVMLNELGRIALERWLATPQYFLHVELFEHVIMPDHVHFVLKFNRIETKENSGTGVFTAQKGTLGSVIRSYKAAVTSRAREIDPSFKWQDRYHDEILFSETALINACKYVRENPKRV